MSSRTDGLMGGLMGHNAISFAGHVHFLMRYGLELKVLPFEALIRKMTGMPAERFGFKDRGVLRVGALADVVVLRPDSLVERISPPGYASGVDEVVVNGVRVDRRRLTDGRPARPDAAAELGEDPRDPGDRPARRDARGRLVERAAPHRLRPHPGRRRRRQRPRRLGQRLDERRPRQGSARGARTAVPGRVGAGARSSFEPGRSTRVLDGPRRGDHPHDQRHRHRPVGHPRPGHRPVGRPPAERPSPRAGPAVRLGPDGGAGAAGRVARPPPRGRVHGIQDRLGPVRARQRQGR